MSGFAGVVKILIVSFFMAYSVTSAFAFSVEGANVSGKARFERHNTLVPFIVCDSGTCPKPEPYWVLVISDEGVDYEVDVMFNRGLIAAPEEVELAGTRIRPGEFVAVIGRVHKLSSSYALVYDVRQAQVISE